MDMTGPPIDMSRLTDADKRELQTAVQTEMQKAKLQESIHSLTDVCWTKCITGAIKSNNLDRSEAACTQNCVDRFLDANELVLGMLSRKATVGQT